MSRTKTRPNKTKSKGAGKGKGRSRRTATNSDKYELYELSVQDTGSECDMVDQVWMEKRNRVAQNIREDFAGSAATSMEWVKRRDENTAIAVDNDPTVLGWAEGKLAGRLTSDQILRLTLKQADVLTVRTPKVDSVLAMNFSYYLFRTRQEMRYYFERAHAALVDDGLFLLDAYGGSEAFAEIEEERKVDGFTYVWDQHSYNPISGEAINYIHFRFPDGTQIKRAFTYGWRVWTLPEIQELLEEVGFKATTIYWEGADEDGDGNGEFTPTTIGDAAEGWIAYIVAEK